MKKAAALFLTVCLLLTNCMAVFAGSVPEDLLHSDEAQIFFAEVADCHTRGEEMVVELIPVKRVKGDVQLGHQLTYQQATPVGNFHFLKNKAYLFAYFDENNPTYAFRVSGYDLQTLSLIVPEDVRRNMFGRFEEYLNGGDYTAAEMERCQRLGVQQPDVQLDGELPSLDKGIRMGVPLAVVGITAVLLLVGTIWGYWNQRKKNPSSRS